MGQAAHLAENEDWCLAANEAAALVICDHLQQRGPLWQAKLVEDYFSPLAFFRRRAGARLPYYRLRQRSLSLTTLKKPPRLFLAHRSDAFFRCFSMNIKNQTSARHHNINRHIFIIDLR